MGTSVPLEYRGVSEMVAALRLLTACTISVDVRPTTFVQVMNHLNRYMILMTVLGRPT
jgi:hypothetical protein